jgi:serine/threonine-protein kinase
VAQSTKVDIQVVAGAPATQAVPNVVGSSQTSAQAALTGAGFVVVVSEQASDTVAAGAVISQSPSGGVVAERGSTVQMVVSSGSPTPTPTLTPSTSASPSP